MHEVLKFGNKRGLWCCFGLAFSTLDNMATEHIVSDQEFWRCETANLARTVVSTKAKLTFKPRGNLELPSRTLESIFRLGQDQGGFNRTWLFTELLVNRNPQNPAITKMTKLFPALWSQTMRLLNVDNHINFANKETTLNMTEPYMYCYDPV